MVWIFFFHIRLDFLTTIHAMFSVFCPVACSFLPGQEAGNVDVVLESGFGEYQKRPSKIAETVTSWLQDKPLLQTMSQAAMVAGNPYAADEIVEDIGRQTVAWMNLNEK
jgi:1,2-diacylglycerol 3-beta-galactosyltransferase